MSETIQQAVNALEIERESHYQSIAEIEKALIPLQKLIAGRTSKPRKYTRRAGEAKKQIKQTNKQTNKARRGPVSRAPRSLPDGDVLTEKILEALRKRSPMSPADLNAAVKGEKVPVRERVKRLAAAGVVTLTGVTMSRLIHLGKGPTSTPAAGPKPNGSMKPSMSSALDQILDRDRAVLGKISEAGQGGRSLKELGILLSGESEDAISSSLTRLRVKKQISADDNGKWVSA